MQPGDIIVTAHGLAKVITASAINVCYELPADRITRPGFDRVWTSPGQVLSVEEWLESDDHWPVNMDDF